jgi:beta-lactamase superfamily II metal-dependent hydrolase
VATEIHFVDVGQGNMVLIKTDDGNRFVFDCNITQDNEIRVLAYVAKVFGKQNSIKAFICSHRDADHMRGVKKLHAQNPISKIWDSGYPGTTTDSTEYREYMQLRRAVGERVIKRLKREDYGKTRLRFMSDADERLPMNANAQGIVIKVEQRSQADDRCLGSAMLPGDSDAETWGDGILKDYATTDVQSSILMAAHHGSNSFFDIPNDQYWYTAHLQAIRPAMVIVSVGPNTHGHPKKEALVFYEQHATGADNGHKVARTDEKGTMKLTLKTEGGWQLQYNQ